MEFNKIFLASVIVYISMTNVFCNTTFRISKFNMCPPEESKFLSLVNLSLGQCVDECSRRKHCYSVGYKRLYKLCELYTTYQMASVSRGRCVIVNKEDIQSQVVTTDAVNECAEWEVSKLNGQDFNCSKQECQVQGALKSVKLVGNINEVGAKKLDICTQSNGDGKQAQTLECSADGKWEIADRKWEFTDGNWETGSTLYMCSSVVTQMTRLLCSQTYIQIFTDRLSNSDANKSCESVGGKLAKVDKEWKFDVLQNLLANCPGLSSGQYWVDGSTERNNEMPWKFFDGTLVPKNQHFYVPDNGGNGPMCFRMVRPDTGNSGDYRFNDNDCHLPYRYICEQN